MLKVSQLSCERDERLLFHNLSFQLSPGDVLQIEGRNGAGKTTLLRIIAGLSSHARGDIFWNDLPLSSVYADFRLASFFLGHKPGVKMDLSPLENMHWRLQLKNIQPVESVLFAALGQVGLYGYEDIPCSHLSAGQLRRVTFACLIASKAKLWILDEPFTAIDIDGVAWLESLIDEHATNGGMVLITSHQPLSDHKGNLRKLKLEDFAGDALEVFDDEY
ncbi:cytochrome c biogenesis heme-transporting ATPase CcmA [Endozoicomonas ascidiicola]|uniref:cytochrome c biogenesis heme-transporting ATPase CcmA n=1 Tax=Endozoicomonas ascidiicola TaxID=1698521 RepID=UPI0008335485|nr:cytochrome c biogenesis heme-transporting ATPase CcmA [Endozoicomonas ascidiicola]